MALDVYCWLAQRLHRVPSAGQQISWQALHDQFGQGYARVRKFREFFLVGNDPGDAMELALLREDLVEARIAMARAEERAAALRELADRLTVELLDARRPWWRRLIG